MTSEPLGKPVIFTHFEDENLYHYFIVGQAAVAAVIFLINEIPINWFSKKQASVKAATYGSEFVAARIVTDQIIGLHLTLKLLDVAIKGKSYLFGDNQSVIIRATIPHSAFKNAIISLAITE